MTDRLNFPATERNRDPILDILRKILPQNGNVLEIASGSGEHVVHFAQALPGLVWQPSDLDERCLRSINAWTLHLKRPNIKMPLSLDTTKIEDWPAGPFDAITCINMVHISPWEATIGLMEQAGRRLKNSGVLYLYGPYRKNGEHTAPSNIDFERWLKDRDPSFGVRDMADVEAEANKNGLCLSEVIPMPANNFSLVFHKG